MSATEIINEVYRIRDRFQQIVGDIYAINVMYDKWNDDQPFIDPADHIDVTVRSTVPSAGDLAEREFQYGEGTGPNGRDELFWSVDGSTVARVEADSEIT